ncbi:MAG: hypothetical protein RBU45_00005, partial [Myxococcota bacterium]|nr:hypothetical protein [Myxococcota bacterium]
YFVHLELTSPVTLVGARLGVYVHADRPPVCVQSIYLFAGWTPLPTNTFLQAANTELMRTVRSCFTCDGCLSNVCCAFYPLCPWPE